MVPYTTIHTTNDNIIFLSARMENIIEDGRDEKALHSNSVRQLERGIVKLHRARVSIEESSLNRPFKQPIDEGGSCAGPNRSASKSKPIKGYEFVIQESINLENYMFEWIEVAL